MWDVIQRCFTHLRFHPNGRIAGFDIPTILGVTHALGYDSRSVLTLIEHAESGLREAVTKHGSSSSERID